MKAIPLALVAALAAGVAAPAMAQEAAGLQPYVGVLGGLHDFDNKQPADGPNSGYRGWVAEGVAGLNYDAGPVVVGVEGSLAKGFDKDIDWEYGAAGRVGLKAGKDSMFFAKVGYQWTQFNDKAVPAADTDRHYHGVTYGGGVEVSLADLGSQADSSNLRFRAQVDTRGNFNSFRPMVGLVAKF